MTVKSVKHKLMLHERHKVTSVWALNRKEPAGRSVLTQAPVNPLVSLFFIPPSLFSLSPCKKKEIRVVPEFNRYSRRGGGYAKTTEKCEEQTNQLTFSSSKKHTVG